MRIFLLLLMIIFVSSAQCALDDDTVVKLYADLGIDYKPDKKTDAEYDAELKKLQYDAKKGEAEAMYKIGRMFEAGQGSLKADMKKALTCYEKAAAKNNAAAMNHLAGMYMTGQGVEADIDKALELYKKSAELGNSDAMCNMGVLNQNGIGFEQNYKGALDWFQKSAEKGNAAGMYNLGFVYNIRKDETFDTKKAIYWFEKAIEAGSTSAMIELGNMYKNGDVGPKRDYKKARILYVGALEKDDRRAFKMLMNACREEECDDSEAMALYEKLKKKLDTDEYRVIYNLDGFDIRAKKMPLLREGIYAKNNYNKICVLYEDGETGIIMERGVLVEPLARWYEKNIEKGDVVSLYQLGMLHRKLLMQNEYTAKEAEQSPDICNDKAIPFFEKAAEQGHVASMYQLGEIYYIKYFYADKDEGDPKKAKENAKKYKELASKWYRKAAVKGHNEAKKALERIKK